MHGRRAAPRHSPRFLVAAVFTAWSCASTPPTAPPPPPPATQPLYVSNSGVSSVGSTVTAYATGAMGDAAPTATIGGPLTGMTQPVGIARDRAGRLYVSYHGDSSIAVYAPGATAEATPTARIAGSNTRLNGFQYTNIAVDTAGRLYVSSGGGDRQRHPGNRDRR